MFDEVGSTEDSQSVEKTLLQISELSWMEGKTSDPWDLELDCLVNLHISTLEEVNIRPGRIGGENDLRLESGLRVALCTGAFQQSAWLPHLYISVRSSFQTVILAFVWHDYSVVNIVIITSWRKLQFLRLAFKGLRDRPHCNLPHFTCRFPIAYVHTVPVPLQWFSCDPSIQLELLFYHTTSCLWL